MKTETIEIVDLGRGPQLSTSRITVQDLLPFYRDGATNDEILPWLPSLTIDQINALKEYIRENYEEVLKAEREIQAHHNRLREAQPAWTRANDHLSVDERRAQLLEKLAKQKSERNGAHDPAR